MIKISCGSYRIWMQSSLLTLKQTNKKNKVLLIWNWQNSLFNSIEIIKRILRNLHRQSLWANNSTERWQWDTHKYYQWILPVNCIQPSIKRWKWKLMEINSFISGYDCFVSANKTITVVLQLKVLRQFYFIF